MKPRDRIFKKGDRIIGLGTPFIIPDKKNLDIILNTKSIGLAEGIIKDEEALIDDYETYIHIENKGVLRKSKCIKYTPEKMKILSELYLNMNESKKKFNDTLKQFIKEETEMEN